MSELKVARQRFRKQDAPTIPEGVAVTRENVAELVGGETDLWPEWHKTATTRAVRINGPFEVATSEGTLSCQQGYLAVDARGYPYPIAVDEFELIYADGPAAVTFNQHGNAMLAMLEKEIERITVLHASPDVKAALEAVRDFALARERLEDALTRYNSARYRLQGTWNRRDPDAD